MTTYRSKIDYWLWITIMALVVFSIITPLFIEQQLNWYIILTLIIPAIIPTILLTSILTKTYYIIDENTHILKVKSGFLFNSKYDINKITKLKETRTWLSAPALSRDRIEITVGRYNKVLISPENKEQFINHITSLNPNIKVISNSL